MITKRDKKILLIPVVLIIAAAAWFARPVSIHTLMKDRSPDCIGFSVWSESHFPDQRDITFTLGTPEADALMERLESIRFHRSPLEPLLRAISWPFGRSWEIDPKKDYRFYCIMYNENGETIQQMEFWISDWSYGPACRLPLYVFNGQEKGRELGTWLWEMAQETEANP